MPQEYEDEPLFDDTQKVDEDDVYDRDRQDRLDQTGRYAPVRYQLLTPEQAGYVKELLGTHVKIDRLVQAQQLMNPYMPGVNTQQAMQSIQDNKSACYKRRNELLTRLGLSLP